MVITAGPVAEGLAVDGVTVRFGDAVAVDDVSLAVAPGEVVALVGPSGCGKSTLLRVIAGLEAAGSGRVSWAGTDLTGRPPEQRGFGLMFQDHALFPHRRVGENVAFGLRVRGDRPADQRARVAEVLDLVGLAGFGDRTIDTLSGGEAQRVALARSLAPAPRLLMLDEPLGSLDRTLRDRLATDLRTVLGRAGVAAVHVTHDQEEAYAVADRLVVMRAGRVVRDGAVDAVWREPGTPFVARFLGHENVLDGGSAASLGLGDGSTPVVVREAALTLVDPAEVGPDGERLRAAVVDSVVFRGATSRVVVRVDRGSEADREPDPDAGPGGSGIALAVHVADPPPVGRSIGVRLDPRHVTPLAPDPT